MFEITDFFNGFQKLCVHNTYKSISFVQVYRKALNRKLTFDVVYLFIFVTWNLRPGTKFQIFVKKSSNTSGVKKCGKGCEYSSIFTNFGWKGPG